VESPLPIPGSAELSYLLLRLKPPTSSAYHNGQAENRFYVKSIMSDGKCIPISPLGETGHNSLIPQQSRHDTCCKSRESYRPIKRGCDGAVRLSSSVESNRSIIWQAELEAGVVSSFSRYHCMTVVLLPRMTIAMCLAGLKSPAHGVVSQVS
jgi:hypothetical protein